jgi:predicted esterase
LGIIDQHVSDEIKYWKETGIKEDDASICKRIFIGGFSQGCAVSLCYALSSQRLLAGVVGFSGHLLESF